jgi:hypothetical protein
METKRDQNQITITLKSEDEKQKLPMNLVIPMVAGALAGTSIIFVLLIGVKMLFNL